MEENVEKKNFKETITKWIKEKTVFALIIAIVLGLIIGCLIMYFVNRGVLVARVNGKTITSNSIFKRMKNYYSIDLFLEDIDSAILNNKYKLDDEERKDLEKTAKKYMEMYAQYYGLTEAEFLSQNGFKDLDEFVDYLSLDYKRTVYYDDYLEKQLEENAVENYYNENAFGKVNTKHILVQVSDNMSEEKAKTIANEIIEKLNDGKSFEDVSEEYTNLYPEDIITEDLGEQGAFDRLEQAYIDGMKALNKGEYSKEPVKTSYGYHVIYCVDKTEKTEKISRKDRNAIIETLATSITSADSNLYYKALIEMRKNAKLKFYDKDIDKKYTEYCEKYVDEEDETASYTIDTSDVDTLVNE